MVFVRYTQSPGSRKTVNKPANFKATRNAEYDMLRLQWSEWGGIVHDPACEDCGNSLEGKSVVDPGLMWACLDCADALQEFSPGMSDEGTRSDEGMRAAERRQMGFTD